MKRNVFFFGLTGALLVMFLAGCSNPTSPERTPTGPDTSALEAGIATAETAKAGVLEGVPANIAPGMAYVSPTDMSNLAAAIDAAKALRDSSSATQETVNNGVTVLAAAVGAFTDRIKYDGTKNQGFSPEELNTLIAAANGAKQGVVTSADGTDISASVYWVTSGVLSAFNTAIATAEGAGGIDARYTALVAAINAFKAALQPGSRAKTVTITGLPAALNGSEIQLGIFETKSVQGNPQAAGMGTIQNGSATVSLSMLGSGSAWAGTGSWYVAFMTEDEETLYITKTAISFSSDTIDVALSDCETTEYGEPTETAGHITGTLSFTGYSGQRPRVRIGAEANFYGGGGYDWVDDRGSSYTVEADGSFSIPFSQEFLTALQSGQRSLRVFLYIGPNNNDYRKELENEITVTAGQLTGSASDRILALGNIGSVSLASITLSGTVTVTLNGQPVPRVDIVVNTQQGGWVGNVDLTTPGANAPWSITLPVLESPTDIFLGVYGYDANWDQQLFSRYNVETITGVSNVDRTGIVINLGSIDTITLSGTIDVAMDGQKPYEVEISAYTDPASPGNSQLRSLFIRDYSAKPNTWSMIVEALPQGTTVYFRIDIMQTNNSDWSGYQTLPVTITAPAAGGQVSNIALTYQGSNLSAPTGLTVTASTINSVTFSWNSVDGAASYRVYRSDSASGVYEYMGVPNGTSFVDSELAANATYYYKVAAVTSAGAEGQLSFYVQGRTLSIAPTGLTVTSVTVSSIRLAWDSVSGGVSSYRLYKSSDGGSSYGYVSVPSTSYTDDGLNAGTTYYYKVAAVTTNGVEGVLSDPVSGTTSAAALSAPTGLTVTASTTSSISLAWNSVEGAIGYNVYASSSGSYALIAQIPGTSYTNSGLSPGTYYYYVTARSSTQVESASSATVQGTTTEDSLPAPTGLTVTASTTSAISLAWNSVSGGVSYKVYRSSDEFGNYTAFGSAINGTSVEVRMLDSETTYYFKVSAVDYNGTEGTQSAAVSGTTAGDPALKITNDAGNTTVRITTTTIGDDTVFDDLSGVVATGQGSYPRLTWETGAELTGMYNVMLRLVNSPNTVKYQNGVSFTSGSATVDWDAMTIGNDNNEDSDLPAPTNLNVTAVTSSSISLAWDSVDGALSYYVYRNNTFLSPAYSTSYTDDGLNASTGYSYTVSAVSSSGTEGAKSYAVFRETDSDDVPPAPGGDTLTVSGYSGVVTVFVTQTTITQENYNSIMSSGFAATGTAISGSAADLIWQGGFSKNGSYNVLLGTTDGYRYQNGVGFSDGSATVNYGGMTEIEIGGGGEVKTGSLTINGLPSGDTFAVYVFAPGTDISSFTAAMNAFVAQSFQAVGAAPASGVFTIIGMNGSEAVDFDASGSLPVLLLNSAGAIMDAGGSAPMYSWASVSFSNGTATASYSSFAGMFM